MEGVEMEDSILSPERLRSITKRFHECRMMIAMDRLIILGDWDSKVSSDAKAWPTAEATNAAKRSREDYDDLDKVVSQSVKEHFRVASSQRGDHPLVWRVSFASWHEAALHELLGAVLACELAVDTTGSGGWRDCVESVHKLRQASLQEVQRVELEKECAHAILALNVSDRPDYLSKGLATGGVPASSLNPSSYLSATDLARHYGLPQDVVRKRLDRWRARHFDGWQEVTERKPREPKHRYQVAAVEGIITEMLQSTSGQTSSERPAKRK